MSQQTARRTGVNADHRRYEYPSGTGFVSGDSGWGFSGSLAEKTGMYGHAPESELEAMMEADFNEDPKTVKAVFEESGLQVDEVLGSTLTANERIVVECIVYGGMTLQAAGEVLARETGRTTSYARSAILKIRDKAFAKLRAHYESEAT